MQLSRESLGVKIFLFVNFRQFRNFFCRIVSYYGLTYNACLITFSSELHSNKAYGIQKYLHFPVPLSVISESNL